MKTIAVETKLLEDILDASYQTYLNHCNSGDEVYATGSLEATANIVYALSCDDELADKAHTYAGLALDHWNDLLEQLQAKH